MPYVKLSLKIILPVFILLLFACKKDHSVLGVDVQPANDDLKAENLQGLPVLAHTMPYDSVASFGDRYKFIGSNNDPNFGRTDMGIYLNANLGGSNNNFKLNSVLSAAEIILTVNGIEYAGNKDAVLTYSVFPLKDQLNVKEIYFTTDTRHHITTPICTATTVYSISSSGKAYIKIPLDAVYATDLLHDSTNLTNNDVFQAKYKGYYIAASLQNNDEGVIFKADLDDDLSGLYLHYKSSATNDTIRDFKFAFTGSKATKYNTLKFTPKQTIKDQFLDSTLGASNLYLKGMGMTKLKIQIPFLENHSDSFKVAVNRAELILYVDPAFTSVTSRYYAPPKLLLLSMDSLSRETYVQDLLDATDYSRYDGNYNSSINGYVFNIAREAQLIFGGLKKNRGFYIVVANADIPIRDKEKIYAGASKELLPIKRDNYYERIVLAGSNNLQLKPAFNLNYIRFKND